MTLPLDALKRRPPSAHCDVVVVGAGLAGLVCAASLALAGRRVVVVDRAKRPGGRLQTVNHQGFAVDLGPVLWEADITGVLEAVGVQDHGLVPLSPRDSIRLSVLGPEGPSVPPSPLPIPGAVPAPSTLDAIRRLYEAPPRLFAALGEIYQEWSGATPDQLAQWRDVDVASWLAQRGLEASLEAAVGRSAVLLGGAPDTPLIVLAGLARALADGSPTHVTIGDTPVAGARGVVQALVDLVIEAGGELRLGTRAIGLGLTDGRFDRLAIRREETPFIEELGAERCVLALSPAAMRPILPSEPRAALDRLLPAAAPARELSVMWGLRGEARPASARPNDQTVVVRTVAPARAAADDLPTAGATLMWSTVAAPRLAPPGHSLVRATLPVPADVAADVTVFDGVVDRLRAMACCLCPGLAEATLWEHCWLGDYPSAAPLRLPVLPLMAPGLSGVLLAAQEVGVSGAVSSGVAAAARAGRAAAERIVAEGSAVPEGALEPEEREADAGAS